MPKKMEEKTYPFEIKAITEEGTFEGYAAVFGKPDAFGEVIEKGAFTKTLQEGKTRPMLWYHDPRAPLGTAELRVDEKGLFVKGMFDLNVQQAREKHSLMRMKAIKGLSFGFRTVKDIWDGSIRRLKELKLFEISPCTFGAHPEALVTAVKQWDEEKPYPNEHSARIKSPGLFDEDTIRRKKDGKIYGHIKIPATVSVLWGKLKGSSGPTDMPIPQALRFPVANWTVVEAKAWLKDNNVKYEKFEAATKSLEGVIEFIEEYKSGRVISAVNMKALNNALALIIALLKAGEPPKKDTPGDGKSLFSSTVEALGEPPPGADKPQSHLFGSTVKALENQNKEK